MPTHTDRRLRAWVLLAVGSTVILTQLLMWAVWEREPVAALLTVGAGLLLAPRAISLDEKRQVQ